MFHGLPAAILVGRNISPINGLTAFIFAFGLHHSVLKQALGTCILSLATRIISANAAVS